MTRQLIDITLQGPVITSAHTATAAEPEALPYIPGALLWGLAATAAYGDGHDKAAVFARFHSGRLRFGDGYPVGRDGIGLPVPMSLHRPKDATGALSEDVEDWAACDRSPGRTQQKHWAVGPGLTEIKVARETTLRTSINPDTGRAADGLLFGFEMLSPGQTFRAMIEGEDAADVDAAVADLLGEQVLGRSKSVEFGRVMIDRAQDWALPETGAGDARYLWCLSDLAAHDEHGQPTERPGDDFFAAAIDWHHSFVRHRRHAPYNAKWGRRMPERLVIQRGSVITLTSGIKAGLRRFGFHQEMGLGVVLASAMSPLDVLRGWTVPEAATLSTGLDRSPKDADKPTKTPLSKWLETQSEDRSKRRSEVDAADSAALCDWMTCYENARRLAAARVGPTPSQWGAIAGARNPEAVLNDLAGQNARKETAVWDARFAAGEAGTFAAKARAHLTRHGPRALQALATALRRELDKMGWFDGR